MYGGKHSDEYSEECRDEHSDESTMVNTPKTIIVLVSRLAI
jgi:hypothetical protein